MQIPMKNPRKRSRPPLLLCILFVSSACAAVGTGRAVGVREASAEIPTTPDILGSLDAPDAAPTSWKERLAASYVYLEERGDYRDLGDAMRRLLNLVEVSDVEPSGAPFTLFFDDPGEVPVQELRARVCIPVGRRPVDAPPALGFDTLPRAMVLYTRVRGSYADVPRVYPTLFRALQERGWAAAGPIRESYLVNPSSVASVEELITEVQIPWTPAR